MAGKYYWIKERSNPQFDKRYYVAMGNITVAAAKAAESTIYGMNVMRKFETEEKYTAEIARLKGAGMRVIHR